MRLVATLGKRLGRSLALLFLSAAVVVATAAPVRAQDAPVLESTDLGEAPIFSAGGVEYRPGRGLRVDSLGLVLGGFVTLKAETTDESGEEFTLDRLNVFLIFDHFDRFRAIADIQMKDIFSADEERVGAHDFALDVRRLFGEITVSSAMHLRVGTFLTPIGYWNLLLAPPLTWTTEAPLIVEETFFEQTTTGIMLHGSVEGLRGRVGYSLFSHFLHPLESDPELDPADHTGGFRLTYDRGPTWSLGLSFQSSEDDEEWSHLAGLHAVWLHDRGEIQGEAYVQDLEDGSQWGAYLQGVLKIRDPFFLVGRYEHFDPPDQDPANLFVAGAVYRILPFMALKLDYRVADRNLEGESLEGFHVSFTTLF